MKFYLSKDQIKQIYTHKGNSGCMASNRITIDGMKVGYMYREENSENFPDSGWRFFAGDESEEYTNHPNHFHIFDLNTICNYDPDIIPYLNAPIGTYWVRYKNKFVEDE